MTNLHAADWGSESPSPAQLKEFFAQIQSGRIIKEDLQKLLRRDHLHYTDAIGILGKDCVFSFEDWWKFFGDQLGYGKLEFPSNWLPWNKETIRNAVKYQKHFLFPGLPSIGGKPLNMLTWESLTSGTKDPRFCLTSHRWDQFSTCCSRWYLMPMGSYIGTLGQSFEIQKGILGDNYEVPSAIERVTANFLFYLKNGVYLDFSSRVRTSEEQILVLGSEITGSIQITNSGLVVYPVSTNTQSGVGLAASLKLPEF
jgi:hypothetical protein